MFDLVIRNGILVTSAGRREVDIAVQGGRIAALEKGITGPAARVLDAAGLYLFPGLIDAHVHFRDPGFTRKEDFATGSRAALYGGMTYVVDMPNVNPVTSTAQRLRARMERARREACLEMGFFALLTSDNLEEMAELKQAGAVGFKIYLGTSVGEIAAPADGVMLEQFRRAARLGMRIGFHAENNAINDYYTALERSAAHPDPGALIRARPDFSEVEAVCKAVAYARETGAAIHIYHVSSGKTVDRIRAAKAEGIDITAETCPHYLLLDEADYGRLGALLKVFPTVKTRWDREKLWAGLADGTIDMIATDHAPHLPEEKQGGLWEAMAGVAGVEISARLMLDAANRGLLTLEQFAAWMSENPARVWGLKDRGAVRLGGLANLTAVDMEKRGVIHNAKLHGKTNVTAFDGVETTGAPVFSVMGSQLFEIPG